MPDLGAFLIVAAGVAAIGGVIGMLVAPAMTRWADREDEDPE